MKTLLRFLQSLIVIIVSIPMVAFSYIHIATIGIVMWTDERKNFKEYTDKVIELWKAAGNYIING